MASKGRFVWYELMTTDVDAAKAFYGEVIGWKTKKSEGGPMPYEEWQAGEHSIGGVMLLPDAAKEMGAPPHWLGHIATPDVDATVAKAQELGANVLVPVQKIPTVGSFAVLADPQGAVSSVYTPEDPKWDPATGGEGFVSWHELNTKDWEAGWKYYSELFGWTTTETMDMGPEFGTYHMFKDDSADKSIGGMMSLTMEMPSHWLYYVTVNDLDAALERVKANGGQVMNGPMEVPGGDRVAQCMDPQGAAFALHWSKEE